MVRLGPRYVVLCGGLFVGGGMALCGLMNTPTGITLAYGVIYGLGLELTYGAGISTAMRFFPDKRGLVGGIATAAYGLSSVVLPPVAHMLISQYGVDNTFLILGAFFGIVIVAGSFVFERCPDSFGEFFAKGSPKGSSDRAMPKQYRWSEMLRSTTFWPMLALLMCGAMPAMMVISQGATLARVHAGFTVAEAAGVVSAIALANMTSRLISGGLSDKIGRLSVLSIALVSAALGIFAMSHATPDEHTLFICGALGVGVSFGAFMGIYPGLTAEQFGVVNASVNYGFMFTGFAMAGLLGPMLMKSLQASGWAFHECAYVGMFFSAVGLALAWLCSRLQGRAKLLFV